MTRFGWLFRKAIAFAPSQDHDLHRGVARSAPNCLKLEDASMSPLESLIVSGTKLWIDSIDPVAVKRNARWGMTGATSNPTLVARLVKDGSCDETLGRILCEQASDEGASWIDREVDFAHS